MSLKPSASLECPAKSFPHQMPTEDQTQPFALQPDTSWQGVFEDRSLDLEREAVVNHLEGVVGEGGLRVESRPVPDPVLASRS